MLTTAEKGHGRVEIRSIRVAKAPKRLNFPGARQVIEIERSRIVKNKTEFETTYAITSLSQNKASPERLLELNRSHWHIENKLHYVRDVSFNEDRRHHRKNPTIFASLNNLAINLFRLIGDAFAPTYQRFFIMNVFAAIRAIGIA